MAKKLTLMLIGILVLTLVSVSVLAEEATKFRLTIMDDGSGFLIFATKVLVYEINSDKANAKVPCASLIVDRRRKVPSKATDTLIVPQGEPVKVCSIPPVIEFLLQAGSYEIVLEAGDEEVVWSSGTIAIYDDDTLIVDPPEDKERD